ncbi:MAG TPA: SPW repeat protein [Pyrinomonadaceae bacterium]|nr:SPW repeat protein [Pyrinomonadaceae bacterium]
MAIEQGRSGRPGSEQGLGVDVGAQAGTGRLFRGEAEAALTSDNVGASAVEGGKPLKPLPHAVADYAMAGMLMAAPWLFGFSRNKKATSCAVATGASVLALSLMTRYPLGVWKLIPFKVHGYIEAAAGAMTAAAPWTAGFSRDRAATITHVASGLATLAVFAVTDYDSAEQYRPLGEQAREYLPEGSGAE